MVWTDPSFPDTGENILCRGVVKLDGCANIEAAPVPFNSSVSISLGPFAEVDTFKNALHEVTSAQLSLALLLHSLLFLLARKSVH